MSLRTFPFSSISLGLALIGFAQSAAAHIQLMDPPPRYQLQGSDTGIKSCPCGLGNSNRTCNLSTDASDPDRSTRVTRAEAGSTITLRFVEFVDHSGTFRVAFDPSGADVADFNNNILVPMVADPPNTNGKMWEIPVTLPNMTCTNCTLQLIQAMNGNTTTPVKDPTSVSTYYACVDLELVAPGTMGGDEGDNTDDPTDMPPPPNEGNSAGSGSMPMGTNTMGTMGTNTMGAGNGNTGAGNTGAGNMAPNLGTVPMMGDSAPANPPTMAGTGTTPSTGVGSLMPVMGMSTSAPSTAAPLMNSASESDDSGGCSLTGFAARTAASPFAALAVAGVFASLAARRRHPRAK